MRTKENDDRAVKMKALYDKGYSLATVGGQFGVSAPSVKSMFDARGWKCRPTGLKEVDPADLEELGIDTKPTDKEDLL